MRGFIFDLGKCVACNACNAACLLENGWKIHPRSVYTFNSEAFPSVPVINYSSACYHCETAACLEGCPTLAYTRDAVTGAVLFDEKKCVGCKYCQWNCPYDAPKFNSETGITGKCTLCNSALYEGRMPACSVSCPTGALKFGELEEKDVKKMPEWFPDSTLKPSIVFIGEQKFMPLSIIPVKSVETEPGLPEKELISKSIASELSLVVFSFFTTLSVSVLISSFVKGIFPKAYLFISLILAAGIISFFHLGRPLRAWRVIFNVKMSPLSREIIFFGLYFLISSVTVILKNPLCLVISVILGLILTIFIDSVYLNSDKRRLFVFHSGQCFLTVLLISSFLSSTVVPFIFIAFIKVVLSLRLILSGKTNGIVPGIRFLRIALLVVTGISFITGISFMDPVLISLFLTGELIDRVIYYFDFNPVNIKNTIYNNLIVTINEAKRYK